MLTFEWPWLLLLLPLPWLYRHWRKPATDNRPALHAPLYHQWIQRQAALQRRPRPRAPWLLTALWLAILTAAARPVWVGETVMLPTLARELMLAVDLSGSMREPDMTLDNQRVDRLTAAKSVLSDFIERRQGDRLGLILFGGRPYLQTPLTHDHRTLQSMLDEAWVGLATDGTAIGDAIGLAVQHLRHRPAGNRVLILLTDGANTMGNLEPLQSAGIAAHFGIRIHTIGFGSDGGSVWGGRASDLDERTLAAIANDTGGRYFRARATEDLENIYGELDRIEPVTQDPEALRPKRSLFHWPMGVALACLLLMMGRPLLTLIPHHERSTGHG